MTFDELRDLVMSIEYDERRAEVHYGCDCGCGGDCYSWEQWSDMCSAADEAEEKLKKFGVTFP